MIEAFPLQWPSQYPRTKDRLSSRFDMTPSKAFDELISEVNKLAGATKAQVIISTNVPVRKKDGGIYSDVAKDEIQDPGVAVYFNFDGDQRVLCCDKWLTPADNIRAISLTVQALRGIDRWGVSEMLKRTFTGFKALPEASNTSEKEWWLVMELPKDTKDATVIKAKYRELVKVRHPDTGGSVELFKELQEAYNKALL